MKTLIVEDIFTHRIALQSMLEPFGTVHIAVNGEEAVKAFVLAHQMKEPYDLICLDILMPGVDGQDVLKQIRAAEDAKRIDPGDGVKIIMTTAMKDKKNVMTAFKQQADGYLLKPVKRAELLKLLRSLGLPH